jgi:hypothetical protein
MKRPTQRDRVRAWLLVKGSITNVEAFQHQILRLSERVRELQGEGLKIEGDWLRENGKRTGTYVYRLVEKPPVKPRLVPQYVEVDGVMKVRMVPEHA